MNLVVFGPDLESREIPRWALKVIPDEFLTGAEAMVRRIGIELYNSARPQIVGMPWVNPRGRGRSLASLAEYLRDPVCLLRALTVSFNARQGTTATAGVVVADPALEQDFVAAREWIERQADDVPNAPLVWAIMDQGFADLVSGEGVVVDRSKVSSLELASDSAVGSFCENLRGLFR